MTKTIEEIQQEIDKIQSYYDLCKMCYSDWDLQDKMKYGRLLALKKTKAGKVKQNERM